MSKMYRVAVLMTTFNGERWIPSQVASVLSQLNCHVELFVSDDLSSDSSRQILLRLAQHHDNLKIVTQRQRQSGSAGRHFLELLSSVDLSGFDYVAFSDQDDVWLPDKIASGILAMNQEGADCYSSNLMAFDQANRSAWWLRKEASPRAYDYLFQSASAGCTYVLSERAASFVGGKFAKVSSNVCPDLGLSHDWAIYACCRSHGLKWFHDSRAFICYRQHERNVIGALPGARGVLKRIAMLRSGWYYHHLLFIEKMVKGSYEEQRVFRALQRMTLIDRIVLAGSALRFRRRLTEVFALILWFVFMRKDLPVCLD